MVKAAEENLMQISSQIPKSDQRSTIKNISFMLPVTVFLSTFGKNNSPVLYISFEASLLLHIWSNSTKLFLRNLVDYSMFSWLIALSFLNTAFVGLHNRRGDIAHSRFS